MLLYDVNNITIYQLLFYNGPLLIINIATTIKLMISMHYESNIQEMYIYITVIQTRF